MRSCVTWSPYTSDRCIAFRAFTTWAGGLGELGEQEEQHCKRSRRMARGSRGRMGLDRMKKEDQDRPGLYRKAH